MAGRLASTQPPQRGNFMSKLLNAGASAFPSGNRLTAPQQLQMDNTQQQMRVRNNQEARAQEAETREKEKLATEQRLLAQQNDEQLQSYLGYAQRSSDLGQKMLSQQEFNTLPDAQRGKLMTESLAPNTLQKTFDSLADRGLFTGTFQDFGNMTAADQSKLIKISSMPKGFTSPEDLEAEYTAADYTPQSWKAARDTGDALMLIPQEAAWGATAGANQTIDPDYIKAEIAAKKDYTKSIAPLRQLQEHHAKLIASLNSDSGAGDLAAVISFMKALDPGSVVREGEVAMAQQVGGIMEQMGNLFTEWTEGDSLSEVSRQKLGDLSAKLVEISKDRRDGIREDYKYTIDRYKYDKKAVMGSLKYNYDSIPKYTPKKVKGTGDLNTDTTNALSRARGVNRRGRSGRGT